MGEHGSNTSGEMNGNALEAALAALLLVVGFLFWNWIAVASLGAGVTLFTVVICAVTFFYFNRRGVKQTKRSLICLGVIVLSSLNFALFAGEAIKVFNFIFLMCSFIAWVCIATKREVGQRLSIYTLGDVINQGIIVPFSNCLCGPKALLQGLLKNKHGKGVLAAGLGLIAILPFLIIVTLLLTTADMAFATVISRLVKMISSNLVIYILQFIVGIPVACYLFGLIYGDVTGKNNGLLTQSSMDNFAKSLRFAPGAAVYAALGAFNALYLIFFASQAGYLFSAFRDLLPQTMTYAEFARRGFFELCVVTFINLCVLTLAYLIAKREECVPMPLRIMNVLLSFFTLLLISTAISKMVLYIKYYGLTQLRIYTTWFMVLLFFFFVIILLRQIKPFPASAVMILGFVICFMVLCYGNVDGLIAKYNVQRYEKGTLPMMNLEAMNQLSDAAVPYLYDAYKKTEDNQVKRQIFMRIAGEIGEDNINEAALQGNKRTFRSYNLQTAQAEKIREELLKNPPPLENANDEMQSN